MSQPTAYSPATDFSQDELDNVGGRSTVRTAQLDGELAAIATTLAGVLTNLSLNQRDDGEIRDGRVKLFTLAADVLALLSTYGTTLRGTWLTATAYSSKDLVSQSGNTYICVSAHTSGTFATDLAAGKWLILSLGTAPGAGTVSFVPTATIAAVTVQAAIDEADTENRALSAAALAVANGIIADLVNTATGKGADMVKFKQTGAGAVDRKVGDRLRETFSIEDYGGAVANSDATNKAALQASITAANAAGGGHIIVPMGISYGYKVADKTTWPSFAGVTVPLVVEDRSTGKSYAGYPTAYDGSQSREFMFTPQTTSPGQHDGNTWWLRGAWAPNLCISNDADLSGARTAYDNRRAVLSFFVNGQATWSLQQGSVDSSTATEEELTNFQLQFFPRGGIDTLTSAWTPLVIERKTGNWSFGGATNTPPASYHFKSASNGGLAVAMLESLTTTCELTLRTSAGSGQDVKIRNVAGVLSLNIAAVGDVFSASMTTGAMSLNSGFAYKFSALTYSASITPNFSIGNYFTITANNGSAFTINAPSAAVGNGQPVTIRVINTSGGALGAVTWNAAYHLAGAWASPATGFSRSITFMLDGGVYYEISRNAADVAN